ncbi:hypothetical protein [Hyphomonas sp.]|uniref:hypothetical protein n=1 Tax=Hyphomonas sp. TaxID=87 RepID=UPI00391CB537
MGRFFRALIATVLLVEIAAIFLGTSIWAFLSELHASLPVIIGAEVVAAVGVAVLAVIIFRRAMASEQRIEAGIPSEG